MNCKNKNRSNDGLRYYQSKNRDKRENYLFWHASDQKIKNIDHGETPSFKKIKKLIVAKLLRPKNRKVCPQELFYPIKQG